MVVVKIGDGLGNQMYNYVCGYAVACHDNDELLLDTSEVDNSTFRSYGLDRFKIDCAKRESFSNRTVLHKIYKRLRRNIKYRVIKEPAGYANYLFERVYEKKKLRNKYLHGYFQNYAYYESCKEAIDRQFVPSRPFKEHVEKLMKEFEGGLYCSLHIRGGDIPPLPLGYYRRAVEQVRTEYPDIKFVVFSNSKSSAVDYLGSLGIDGYEFIWNKGEFDDFDELFLMKSCGCHIISDSTFSRWAAFLDKKCMMCVAPAEENGNRIYPDYFISINPKEEA